MFVFAVRFQIVNELPCVFPKLDSASFLARVRSLSVEFQRFIFETPLKKPPFASGLLFVKNYFATFDNEYYTLSDIIYSGERRTSTRLFHVIFICSGFLFPCYIHIITLAFKSQYAFALFFHENQPTFAFLDILSGRIKIFVWYQGWKRCHAENPATRTGKSSDCLSQPFV